MPLLESREIETVESRCRNPFPDDGEVEIAGQNSTKEEAVQDARNERNIPFDRGWAWVIVLGRPSLFCIRTAMLPCLVNNSL